jgi:signal transduction histidine kinase
VDRRLLHLLDALVPVLVALIVLAVVSVRGDAEGRPLEVALALAAAAALALRRRAPAVALAVSGGLVLVLFALDEAAGAAAVLAPAVALFSLALTRGRAYTTVAALAAVAAVVAADSLLGGNVGVSMTFGHVALVAIPLLAAEALRYRRSYVSLLLEQLEHAERTREEEARRRAEQERVRIARDLHDVVAHTLATINVQAGVAAHLLHREPTHARAALATIEDASREALNELRAIVGVLRANESDDPPLQPAPTIDAVAELVERARARGLDVSLELQGEPPEAVPEAVQVAAFRIIQESLTNVQRHAAGASAHINVSFEPSRLLVAVENSTGERTNGDGPGGGGVGIIGMKERAEAVGGTLQAMPSGHGFRVAAELPYRRAM